ncbi:MAG: hypothetical protein HYZ90_06065, partial [Candidatus Omnitrophica bacterium]|nr:hypothetical protein [Candidatus Omnitrophota bacterium]
MSDVLSEQEARRVLEALLLVSEKPLLIEQAREALGGPFQASDVRRMLTHLSGEYVEQGRGLRIL